MGFIAEKTGSIQHQSKHPVAEPARQLDRDRGAAVVTVEAHTRDT